MPGPRAVIQHDVTRPSIQNLDPDLPKLRHIDQWHVRVTNRILHSPAAVPGTQSTDFYPSAWNGWFHHGSSLGAHAAQVTPEAIVDLNVTMSVIPLKESSGSSAQGIGLGNAFKRSEPPPNWPKRRHCHRSVRSAALANDTSCSGGRYRVRHSQRDLRHRHGDAGCLGDGPGSIPDLTGEMHESFNVKIFPNHFTLAVLDYPARGASNQRKPGSKCLELTIGSGIPHEPKVRPFAFFDVNEVVRAVRIHEAERIVARVGVGVPALGIEGVTADVVRIAGREPPRALR